MPQALIGGAISAGTSLLGGLLGKGASSSAGNTLAKASANAAQNQNAAGAQAQSDLTGEINRAGTTVQPYTNLGSSTAKELTNALAPGGSLTQGWNQTFSGPTAAQAAATPGEQFMLQQGINALQNSAAAKGGLLSTGTAKNLTNYAEGTASTGYQQAYNNALQSYNTNQNSFYTNQNNLFNRLYSTTGLGANTASNLNSTQLAGTNALANNITNTAQLSNQDLLGGAQATAAAQVGGINALVGGLGAAGNAIGQGITLQGMLGAQNSSNSGTSGSYNAGNPYATSGNGNFIQGMTPGTYDDYSNALQGPS